ncbi:kinase-like protein [Exidia glandulosa HHB12029]|uniref:Kinase-like protein n=1 Tax=Exidia glandulosa HHB12029 TaxID=1314781 RepID=A0A165D9L9_EXIGL|nr:kinase-like protein [Exidia glandulosa HHB12029]
MFAAASSLFARTNISQNYIIHGPNQPLPPPQNGLPAPPPTPPFHVGLWRVANAAHKTTGKRVSVWTFEKRSQEMDRLTPAAKERVVDVLKAEASALGRLRHPCILEMVEPVEETRSELVFATEMLLSSLQLAIPTGTRNLSTAVELDETEILKGILQVCKGLSFLHTSARLIHSNLTPSHVVINAAGDWKISGLGLTVPLVGTDGSPSRWEFMQYDSRMPTAVQRNFDYLAPEYNADSPISTASDMWSLGCLIYAVHNKGSPPFKNHGSLATLRDNANKHITGMESWDPDLRSLVSSLVTPNVPSRPSPSSLPSYAAFSSLPISTLNFLDRTNFASKTREEKIIFMKGLTGVLDRFSDGLKTRKILPSLLEEMKDTHLLPSILPNVFAISSALSPTQFASTVLPALKPLFAVKEPPQNMLTLLDNLELLQGKTEKAVFKEHVLPLVYHALESEHGVVQEKALGCVPALCDTIDYAEVQGVIFPRVALVFTKTRILTVKVATLVCFKSMVKTLDQMSLTKNLVPLLYKIKTKEPAVMLATLDLQEAMGLKVDREAVATLVLPQLWAMSIGPLLNLDQFSRFMRVIRTLGERVEKEHMQFLRDSQRIEDRTAVSAANGTASQAAGAMAGTVNFQSLVSGGGANAGVGSGAMSPAATTAGPTSWDDDVWGSILNNNDNSRPTSPPSFAIPPIQTHSLPGTPKPLGSGGLSMHVARPSISSQFATNSQRSLSAAGAQAISPPTLSPPLAPARASPAISTPPMRPFTPPTYSATPLQPARSISAFAPSPLHSPAMTSLEPQKPNYNISLPAAPVMPSPSVSFTPMVPNTTSRSGTATKKPGQQDWGDFDPLA